MYKSDGWIPLATALPDNNIVVQTKIHDWRGSRNEQPLKRNGNLWFCASGSIYVYYTPTHWKPLT